ncbi:hypothetical protein ABZV58_14610 [Nocardia sp. NPDC004654]|uniref:hypothetical protein n=1 Tax=Nocardia sp. NPDC004654 TaxID=3154776 RepID=UPI0033A773A5
MGAHGGKTVVLNRRENAGLGILSARGRVHTGLYDIAVVRRSAGPDSARLCGQRADPDQLTVIRAASARPDATASPV